MKFSVSLYLVSVGLSLFAGKYLNLFNVPSPNISRHNRITYFLLSDRSTSNLIYLVLLFYIKFYFYINDINVLLLVLTLDPLAPSALWLRHYVDAEGVTFEADVEKCRDCVEL